MYAAGLGPVRRIIPIPHGNVKIAPIKLYKGTNQLVENRN
jgi:hypothetical protein